MVDAGGVNSAFQEPVAPVTASGVLSMPEAPRWAKLLLLPAVVSVTLTLDQGSKLLAQRELAERVVDQVQTAQSGGVVVERWMPTRKITVVPGLFDLRYVENPAAAFSLTSSMPEWFRKPFLVSVSLVAMFLIISWYWRTREPDWLILGSFSFILGGALGNLVDRIAYGYVIDFLDCYLGFVNAGWPHWPTFNVADTAICFGAGGVILRTFKPYVHPDTVPGSSKPWPAQEAILESAGGGISEPPVEADAAAGGKTPAA